MIHVRLPTFIALAFLLACGGCTGEDPGESASSVDDLLFERLSPKETEVEFANALSEKPTPHRTELLYEYFTNGAGVAAGDLTGNGRVDLYFTGNMRHNKLYLNGGDMSFRDVTAQAGVRGRKNTWNTGVTMADVNGDSRLDLYVCYSGDLPLDRRVDELYINQGTDENGVPQFEEKAGEYGLAHPHSSNQAYFFDYDRDGDLDLYLQTHNVETLPREDTQRAQKQMAERDSVNGNRFYEQRNGHFVDVTALVGIQSSPLTYGLGAAVSDYNKDGWPDIYVGNDYSAPDYLYINQQDGTFSNRIRTQMSHTSRASMGIDGADINNDRWSDIFVLDMIAEGNRRQKLLHIPNNRKGFERNVASGFYYQYTVNTLQLNNGNGTYSEIGQLAVISNTDWSWAPLLADFNNDGWKDLYVTNGILHDITNRDFIKFRRQYIRNRNYDLQPKDVAVLMKNLSAEDLENYAFRNDGGTQFKDVSSEWGLADALNSNGAAYADLDNDGDLDLVTNNVNNPAAIYENHAAERTDHHYLKVRLRGEGKNTSGLGTKLTLFADSTTQYLEQYPTRGYLSSVSPVLHFGLGERTTVDSLRAVWPDGRTQVLRNLEGNQTLTLHQEDAIKERSPASSDSTIFDRANSPIAFEHRMEGRTDDFRQQPLLVHAKSFDGPALTTGDVTGNGRKDVFVGGGSGQAGVLYRQLSDGTFERQPSSAFRADRASNDVEALFLDFDGDGDQDLYVGSGGYSAFSEGDPALQDRLYVNDGTGTFSRVPDALPRMRTSTGAVASTDVNDDGRPDLFVGGRVVPDRYPESPQSYLLVNEGDGSFTDRTADVASGLDTLGMVTGAQPHDLNGDGSRELVVVGEWMPITVFESRDGTLDRRTQEYFERPYRGFWYSVELFETGEEGSLGLVAGNLGRNTQLRARREAPAELFYDDFDSDGAPSPILSYYIDGRRYPHVLLDRLRQTIPSLANHFSSYEEYASATLDDLLTFEELQRAGRWSVNHLETTLFVSEPGQLFEQRPLPLEAQFSPVFSTTVLDYNNDGATDLLLSGNMNETRVRFPKYDANYGILLKGTKDGGFEYVPQRKSGFQLRGDVRAIVPVQNYLLFGLNRDSVQAYRP